MTLPIARTEPSCFCNVDGCFAAGFKASHFGEGDSDRETELGGGKIGGANIAVGDGAASCELKAPSASSGTTSAQEG